LSQGIKDEETLFTNLIWFVDIPVGTLEVGIIPLRQRRLQDAATSARVNGTSAPVEAARCNYLANIFNLVKVLLATKSSPSLLFNS
jgi:hypothetical protein